MSLLPLGILSSSGAGGAGAFELISTQVLTGTASSISFSSIVGTYKHLQLRVTARADTSWDNTAAYIRFNSDSGSNYAWHRLDGYGSGIGSSGVASQTAGVAGYFSDSSSASGIYGVDIVDIYDYASTSKNKTLRSLCGVVSSAKEIGLRSSLWASTAAITSIYYAPQGGSWVAGSRFSLYGVKGS